MPTPSVKRQRQRPIQVNGDFSQVSTQAASGIFEVCRLPLGVFMPLMLIFYALYLQKKKSEDDKRYKRFFIVIN